MTLPHDRQVAAWLAEDAHAASPESLARALAATRRTRKRPRWTFPERWIPMQLTMAQTRSPGPILTIATLALLMVALVATALLIGSRRQPLPLYRNGAVVFERDGDLFVADQLDGASRALVVGPESDSDPVFSPQGDRIAFVREAGHASVVTVRPDGTDVRELAQLPSSTGLQLDWAPDGRAILASSDGTFGPSANGVILIDSDGSGSRTIGAGVYSLSGRAAWRPDGRHIGLIAEQDDRMVTLIADADGTNMRLLPIDPMTSQHAGLAWSPDGTRLALGESEGSTITVVEIDADGDVTRSRDLTLDPETSVRSGPSWSPDGSRLAVGLRDRRVAIVEADGSGYGTVGPPDALLMGSTAFAWSPDGRSLVITSSALREDPVTRTSSWTETSWSIDVASGEQVEVTTPVDTWQRLEP